MGQKLIDELRAMHARHPEGDAAICGRAADEIERLRGLHDRSAATVRRLREALVDAATTLEQVADGKLNPSTLIDGEHIDATAYAARAALEVNDGR